MERDMGLTGDDLLPHGGRLTCAANRQLNGNIFEVKRRDQNVQREKSFMSIIILPLLRISAKY